QGRSRGRHRRPLARRHPRNLPRLPRGPAPGAGVAQGNRTTPEGQTVTTPPKGPARRAVLLGAVALALLALGWYLSGWYAPPAPPELSLADADPAVVRVIESARRDVWWKPRSAAAWGRLGQRLRAHGYRPESNFCFAQAERLNPQDPRWSYLQGIGLQSDDPEAAIAHLERAVALCGRQDPDAPQLSLAEVCFQQGRLDEAEQHFRQVLRRDRDNARAHLGLGRLA